MEYLQNYVKEDVKMIQAMENKEPEKIQKRLEKDLNQKMERCMAVNVPSRISKRRTLISRH